MSSEQKFYDLLGARAASLPATRTAQSFVQTESIIDPVRKTCRIGSIPAEQAQHSRTTLSACAASPTGNLRKSGAPEQGPRILRPSRSPALSGTPEAAHKESSSGGSRAFWRPVSDLSRTTRPRIPTAWLRLACRPGSLRSTPCFTRRRRARCHP